ncbi:hypothetical protein DYU05_14340 [Mucilaginibacter terrenus]|uniref:Uncharacterized protein n=1 Tax=Mucilaginibacter terrenus TaxID=2482727 RepID=A0A3E2NR06_9SPHI|nr:hypothetical protein [Mucilaginibacter terrenus]RFZ83310.1 hypothetical protein DYU05_14340 [Mucilaginibacter terrenus]
MRKFITTAIIILAAIGSKAQTASNPTHGFWVAESNKETPKLQVIKFYNDNSRLIYTAMVTKPVNIKKKSTQQMLNNICEELYRHKEGRPALLAINIR